MSNTKMRPLRFCANLTMLFTHEGSLLNRYELAKKAGFKGVECAFPYDVPAAQLKAVKSELGLEQVLINAVPGDSLGLAAMIGREQEFMESIKKSVEYCKALDCRRLHIMSGKPLENGSLDVLRKNLASAIPILEENQIVGLIEPINNYSVPGYFLHDFEIGEQLVKSLNSPYLRLQLDIFHLQLLRGDLTHSIKRFLPITGHIQIAQVPDRHEPNTPGEINFKYLFDLLQQEGYDGWIGLEYKPSSDTESGLSWIRELGQSLE